MTSNKFEIFLNKLSGKDWLAAVEKLLTAIHEVDKNATQIWFRFFPLELHNYLETAEDKAKAIHQFAIVGEYDLKNQIDSSHKFLYGHRFWKETKAAIENRASSFKEETADLTKEVEQIAQTVAEKAKVDKSLTLGITAVGLMTLTQVGLEAFKSAGGETSKPQGIMTKSPDQIVAERAQDDSQGMLGFLRTVDKKYTVSWIDARSSGKFAIKNDADIANASGLDQSQDWKSQDERCWEGVVPVECRSAACGTCWVGIVGGADKLSDVKRLERKQMEIFGYNQSAEAKPFLRLACQAKASGNVSIVIPPWNGVFGRKIYGVDNVELEPATTSAAKLRETIATAVTEE